MVVAEDKDKFSRIVLNFSTKTELPGEADSLSGSTLGLIHYSGFANHVVRLDFYIPSGFRINRAIMHLKAYDQPWVGGTTSRLQGIKAFLNPNKTRVTIGGSDSFRFSGGTLVLDTYTPLADEETKEIILTQDMLQKIVPGWNAIIIQQESQDLADQYLGRLVANLVIRGYLTWQTK